MASYKPTLRTAIIKATAARNNSSSSEKNPAWYNRQKGRFITSMVTSVDEAVRAAALKDTNCPATHLKEAIKTEASPMVLKAIFMNPNTPLKAIEANFNDARMAELDNDEELTQYLVARIEKK